MPTILHTESSEGWGGQEGRLMREAEGLRKKGWRILMACQPNSRLEKAAKKADFPCFTFKMKHSTNIATVKRLIKLFKQEQVDLVVTHSSIDSWLTGWAASLSRPKPVVVRVRHLSGGIHTRLVYTHLCDAIVAISKDIKWHMSENKGIKADKIHVIYSGIDTARFKLDKKPTHLRNEWEIKPEDKLVGIIAVLRNKKGHRFLIRAAPEIIKKHPDTKFIFVGSGPKDKEIREEITAMGLQEHFILTGARKDIPEILNSLDIFVLPSQMEALGQAIIEAMSAGLPVVASNVGGIPELVKDGRTGFLVPKENPQALAEAINKLLAQPKMAKQMGQAGQQFVQSEFDYQHMIDKTDQLYKKLLSRAGKVK